MHRKFSNCNWDEKRFEVAFILQTHDNYCAVADSDNNEENILEFHWKKFKPKPNVASFKSFKKKHAWLPSCEHCLGWCTETFSVSSFSLCTNWAVSGQVNDCGLSRMFSSHPTVSSLHLVWMFKRQLSPSNNAHQGVWRQTAHLVPSTRKRICFQTKLCLHCCHLQT